MSASTSRLDLTQGLADWAGYRIRPERLNEASQLAQANVEAVQKDFQSDALDAVPAEFVSILQAHK